MTKKFIIGLNYEDVRYFIRNNPEYEYIFHNSYEREKFIKENFEKNVFNAYNRIVPGAYKCDLWRYCVLYIYGGIYVDIDSLCIGKLDTFINNEIEFIVPIDLNINTQEGHHNLACGFIGSISRSPILLNCINSIIYNVENNIIPNSKLDFSGPGLLGREVNKYLNLPETNSFIGKEGIDRHATHRGGRHRTAVGLHDARGDVDAQFRHTVLEAFQIAVHHRHQAGIDGGGGEAFEFAEFRQHI